MPETNFNKKRGMILITGEKIGDFTDGETWELSAKYIAAVGVN